MAAGVQLQPKNFHHMAHIIMGVLRDRFLHPPQVLARFVLLSLRDFSDPFFCLNTLPAFQDAAFSLPDAVVVFFD